MASQNALQDKNQIFSLTVQQGSAGTAALEGTAATMRVGGDPVTGAAYVYNLGPAGNVSVAGTDPTSYLPARLTDGTSFYTSSGGGGGGTTVTVDHGTVTVTNPAGSQYIEGTTAGTLTGNVILYKGNSGTTTVPSSTNPLPISVINGTTAANILSGTLNAGTISMLSAGTLTTIPNIPGGTIDRITNGSIVVVGFVQSQLGTLNNGTVNMTSGTLNVGTVVVSNSPTVNMASGTLNLGTITGNTGMSSGTLNVGTVTVSSLVTGTILSSGTTTGVGTVTNLGSVTNIGGLSTGTINLGTVIGQFLESTGSATGGTANIISSFDASSYRQLSLQMKNTWVGTVNVQASNDNSTFVTIPVSDVSNITPGPISNINANGLYSVPINARFIKVVTGAYTSGTAQAVLETYALADSNTIPSINVSSGTLVNNQASGTLNLGTVNMTSGTLNVGTVAISNSPVVTMSAGTLNLGTVNMNSGTLNVGTVVNNGGTVAVVSSLTNGSIIVTAGTVSAGTINTGTITAGSIVVTAGTVSAGTVNAGTIQLNPLVATNTISNAGVTGTTAIGTLVTAASIGAATAAYITGYEILVISGTPEVCLAFGTVTSGNQVISHGLFPAGGGVSKAKIYAHGYGTTNSAITYQIISGSGTVSWSVDYFLHT